jgi:O-antigen ligase
MALGVWAIGAAVLGGRDLLRRLIRPGLGALVAAAGLVPSIVGAARPLPAVVGVAMGAAIAAMPSGRVRPGRARVWVIAAAVLLVAGGAWAVARDGGSLLRTRADASPASRFESWGGAIDAFRSSPWVGTGPGSLDLLFHASGSGQGRRPMASPFAHNEYLQVLAETGALGLAGVMAALVLLIAWCWRRRPPASSPERIVWAAGAAACAAFALHSFVDFEWHFPVVVAFAFAWLGLATTRPAVPDEKGEG